MSRSIYVYVCVCLSVCVHTHMQTYVCNSQRLTLGVFSISCFFLRYGLFPENGAHNWARLVAIDRGDVPVSGSLALESQTLTSKPSCSMGAGDPNSGS